MVLSLLHKKGTTGTDFHSERPNENSVGITDTEWAQVHGVLRSICLERSDAWAWTYFMRMSHQSKASDTRLRDRWAPRCRDAQQTRVLLCRFANVELLAENLRGGFRKLNQQCPMVKHRNDFAQHTMMPNGPSFTAEICFGFCCRCNHGGMGMPVIVTMIAMRMLMSMVMRMTTVVIVVPQPWDCVQKLCSTGPKQDHGKTKPCGKLSD